eukprot:10223527-Alexandrium_andersonii.AAC.1
MQDWIPFIPWWAPHVRHHTSREAEHGMRAHFPSLARTGCAWGGGTAVEYRPRAPAWVATSPRRHLGPPRARAGR